MVQVKTELDIALLTEVQTILSDLGKNVVVEYYDDSSAAKWNPTTFEIDSPATTNITLKATPPFPYKGGFTTADAIELGDMQTFVSGVDVDLTVWTPRAGLLLSVPIETDTQLIYTDIWRIKFAGPIFSGAKVVLWEFVLERSGQKHISPTVLAPSAVSIPVVTLTPTVLNP